MNSNDRLRWGIIGCDAIGPKHVRFPERMSEVSLVASANLEPEVLERMRTRFG